MKIKLLLPLLFFAFPLPAQFTQSVIGSMGGEITSTSGEITFTQSVGDVAGTFEAANFNRVNFSQGFVQCFACDDCPVAVSVTEFIPGLELNIFPNPTSGQLNITGATDQIRRYLLFNVQGRLVAEGAFQEQVPDLSLQPSGMYLLRLLGQNGTPLANVKIIRR